MQTSGDYLLRGQPVWFLISSTVTPGWFEVNIISWVSGIKREGAHACYNPAWAHRQVSPFVVPSGTVAVARRCDVAHLGRKTALLMIHDDNAALCHRRDVGGAAASGRRMRLPFSSTLVSVEIAKAVNHFSLRLYKP